MTCERCYSDTDGMWVVCLECDAKREAKIDAICDTLDEIISAIQRLQETPQPLCQATSKGETPQGEEKGNTPQKEA